MSRRILQRWPLLGAAWFGLVACAQPTLVVHAEGCWGEGASVEAASCLERQTSTLGALGLLGVRIPELQAVAQAMAPQAAMPTAVATRAAGTTERPVPSSTNPTPMPGVATLPGGATPTPGVAVPTMPTSAPKDDRLALIGDNPCAEIQLQGIEKKGSLTGGELLCLQALARGKAPGTDPDLQVAAVALYNIKASGWMDAVEAALSRPSLANAPALNFAAIKPAYDAHHYVAVLQRAAVVWKNLDKGYQLGAADRTFVVEFACRSAGQLALSGKVRDDGLDWCERWKDRALKDGAPTAPIDDIIRQLE